jgi:hypothetical protein
LFRAPPEADGYWVRVVQALKTQWTSELDVWQEDTFLALYFLFDCGPLLLTMRNAPIDPSLRGRASVLVVSMHWSPKSVQAPASLEPPFAYASF